MTVASREYMSVQGPSNYMQLKLRLHEFLGVGKKCSDDTAWKREAQLVMAPLIDH